MADLSFSPFDCDNHYYEARDAFTRHLDPAFKKRGIQWAVVDGKERLLAGGRLWRFIPNPTWDPIARPGCLDDYFRGKRPKASSETKTTDAQELANLQIREAFGDLDRLADHPEYQDREARLRTLDAQGLAGCFLFPTQGAGLEEPLSHDTPALVATMHAFNEWIDEDWGFCYQDRLFGSPMITLADPQAAIEELRHVAAKGARIIYLRPGPVRTPTSSRSPGDAVFDPFWEAVVEAGIVVGFHGSDSGYHRYIADWGESNEFEGFRQNAFTMVTGIHDAQPIGDTMAALVCHGVFDRHPDIRVASVENGSVWVTELLASLKKAYAKTPHLFQTDPVESFRQHVWVSPYYEDDIRALADLMGIDRLLMGSDWPHGEGLPQPADYIHDLVAQGFDAEGIRRIMRENALSMIGLQETAGSR